MITPMDAEKAFDKVQNSCMIKTVCKLTVKRSFLYLKKNTYTKPKVNIILNDEKLETSPLRLGARQGCPSRDCFSVQYWPQVISKTRKGNKMYTDWEERHKTVFLHRWHNCHAENLKESTRKLLKPKVIITRWKDVS